MTMFIQRKASTLSSTSRQLSAKKRFIACRIGAEQYAFPLEFIERILDEFLSHGNTNTGFSLIRFQGETLTIIDLRYLFSLKHESTSYESTSLNYLIICQNSNGEKIGIPVEELPHVITVSPEQIQPIPDLYRKSNLPKALSAIVTLNDSEELFYLDIDQVMSQENTSNSIDSIEELLLASLNR